MTVAITYDMPVSVLHLTKRVRKTLDCNRIQTVGELVWHLGELGKASMVGARQVSEITEAFKRNALTCPSMLTPRQLSALCEFSHSTFFAFDVFGRLFSVNQRILLGDSRVYQTMGRDALIRDLPLPIRLKRALIQAGCIKVGQAAAKSDEELLALRGVGKKAVDEFRQLVAESMTPESMAAPSACLSRGARLAAQECIRRHHPICLPVYDSWMPLLLLERLGNDKSASAYAEAALEAIEGSPDLIDACASALASELAHERDRETVHSPAPPLAVHNGSAWEAAAQRLQRADKLCAYEPCGHVIHIRHPRLADWIEQGIPDERNARIVRMYLDGNTLQSCGDSYGLTRERVRQIVTRELCQAPLLRENRYRYFFETYRLAKCDFMEVTGEPVGTFLYLRITRQGPWPETLPLSKATSDVLVPQQVREGARAYLDAGYLYADGCRVRKSRSAILEHLARMHASEEALPLSRLHALYDQFIVDYGLSNVKGLAFGSMRVFETYVGRCERLMKLPHVAELRYGGAIRFFDPSTESLQALAEALKPWAARDIECSSSLLMRDESLMPVLEELDIRNEYELHYVLLRKCPPVEGMSLGRSPTVVFGAGNRHDQMLNLIMELSPASAMALAQVYGERYGVDPIQVAGDYLSDFRICLTNGKYVYRQQELSQEQRQYLRDELAGMVLDYCSLRTLRARFASRFPQAPAVFNEHLLEGFGFHVCEKLLVRNGLDVREVFGRLLDGKRHFRVCDPEFGEDVVHNRFFARELARRQRALQIVEYERDSYLNTSLLRELDDPVSTQELGDYIRSALSFMLPDKPYTISRLRKLGFTHALDRLRDDVGFDDFFYASLLAVGRTGGKLKSTVLGCKSVFCRTAYTYSGARVVEQIMEEHDAMDLDDLIYLLEEAYGVRIGVQKLRTIVSRSDLYLNEALDMVFDSKESYRRKVREWIS